MHSINEHRKQLVIVSGKGGTGKTTIAAALAALSRNKLITDCDVDAANLHILLKPNIRLYHEFRGSKKASINPDLCTQCGLCETYCRFDAIKKYVVDFIACEGCGFCFRVCPENAITFTEAITGIYHEGEVCNGDFLHAGVYPGEGNSGKLVSELKAKANEVYDKHGRDYYFVDGPPGIGCPVNASLSGAGLALVVTEPTVSGLHDLKRMVGLINRFQIPIAVIINKYDLNIEMTGKIDSYAARENLNIIGYIPFDESVVSALRKEKSITDFPKSKAAHALWKIWHNLQNYERIKQGDQRSYKLTNI